MPTPIRGKSINLGKFFLEVKEFASTESGNTTAARSVLLLSEATSHTVFLLRKTQPFYPVGVADLPSRGREGHVKET